MFIKNEVEKVMARLSGQVENLTDNDDDAIMVYKCLKKNLMASIDEKIKALVFDTTKKGDKMATTKKAEDKKVLPTSTEKSEDEIYSQQRQRNMKKVYRLLQQKRSKKNERTR